MQMGYMWDVFESVKHHSNSNMNPNPSIDSLTLVYLKVDELEVKLDLYLPPDAHGTLPAIIVLHGGFLTVGDRSPSPFVPMWMLGPCFEPYIYIIA